MDPPSPAIRSLARQLVALEAKRDRTQEESANATLVAVQVSEKLRLAVERLAGRDGFYALLRRAAALARNEAPGLARLTVTPDGSLQPSAAPPESAGGGEDHEQAAEAITAHLLWLLVTFIGEQLTMQLVHEAWPQTSGDDAPGNRPGVEGS